MMNSKDLNTKKINDDLTTTKQNDHKYLATMAEVLGKEEDDLVNEVDYNAIKKQIEQGLGQKSKDFYPEVEPVTFDELEDDDDLTFDTSSFTDGTSGDISEEKFKEFFTRNTAVATSNLGSDDSLQNQAVASKSSVPKKRKKHRKLKPIPKFILQMLCVLLVVHVLKITGVLMLDKVSGTSMYPTLNNGSWVITTNLTDIQQYDIITAKNDDGTAVIKRVIGMPGDTVVFKNGHVYVNGKLTKETFIAKEDGFIFKTNGSLVLEDNEYFLCGDNREYSRDSRTFGPVTKDDIMGEVIFNLNLPF